MHEVILSVGIDIGTSTTQLIFSRLTIENRASSYTVPRIDIVDKEVIYRSKIYFTPLRSATEIDAGGGQTDCAGGVPGGRHDAGDAPHGCGDHHRRNRPEGERQRGAGGSVRPGRRLRGGHRRTGSGVGTLRPGAGTDALSKEKRTAIANVDIGGGTSNIAVYEKGVLRGTCCLDIGGRLIKVENGRISYIFPKIQALAAANGISLAVGDRAYPEQLYGVCRLMAAQLAQALRLAGADSHHAGLYTNNGKPLPEQPAIRAVTYSGGVADCIYQEMEGDVFRFGDIGVLLGKAIRADPDLSRVERFTSIETIRATVVGAGTHTTEVSGSTIHYEQGTLP